MSLEESDYLNIPDATPVDPTLEACSLPKSDIHLYKSSLTESHVKYFDKLYGILEDLYPRVVPEGMTMNVLSPGAIGLYAHHFQQGGLRLPFFLKVIEHFCVHNSQLVPLGLFNVWKHVGRTFSLKDSEGKVITMAEFLRLPNFKEDIPPKTGDMMSAEIPSRKVLDDKEKKKRKDKEKVVPHAADADFQVDKVAMKRGSGREGGKKRKVRMGAPVQQYLEHVSSPTPLNHALPLETLANTEHVSPNVSAGRGISGLQIQPSPPRPA
nr:hypothetical protein [Tanacetum cinerariifolium]GEZ20524.1 hypothetical protein [Tanacetum cinerariifolium]